MVQVVIDGRECELIDSGVRLDECVSRALGSSRSQAQEFIKRHGVMLNGKHTQKCGIKLAQGSEICISLPESSTPETKALDFAPLDSGANMLMEFSQEACFEICPKISPEILYEDGELLILNKPPHLVVHGAPSVKEPTLVDWLQARGTLLSSLGGEQRAGIVHRLDKQTSGAIAIAKTNHTHANLSQQLKERSMGRYYLALIDAPLREPRVITCQLDRHPNNRLKMANVDSMRRAGSGARFSKSTFLPLLCTDSISLVAIKLHTGRTHQIRAHLESINRHILGDSLYGYKGEDFGRVMLHAYLLYLNHPATGEKLAFCASIFTDMLQCAHRIFGAKEFDEAIQQETILRAFSQLDSTGS